MTKVTKKNTGTVIPTEPTLTRDDVIKRLRKDFDYTVHWNDVNLDKHSCNIQDLKTNLLKLGYDIYEVLFLLDCISIGCDVFSGHFFGDDK